MRRFESCRGHQRKGRTRTAVVGSDQVRGQPNLDGKLLGARIVASFEVERFEERAELGVAEELEVDVEERQHVEQFRGLLGILSLRGRPLGGLELLLALSFELRELLQALADLPGHLGPGFLGLEVRHLAADAKGDPVHLGPQTLRFGAVIVRPRIGAGEGLAQERRSLRPEHPLREEGDDLLPDLVLAQVHRGRMVLRDEAGGAAKGVADVVADAPAVLAVHPEPAQAAPDKGTEQVGPGSVRLVGGRGACRVIVASCPQQGLVEHLARHERVVGGLLGPDPRGGWVHLAAALAGPAVPDLVAGVLGVVQDLPDAGASPLPEPASRVR